MKRGVLTAKNNSECHWFVILHATLLEVFVKIFNFCKKAPLHVSAYMAIIMC
jgi:hypothetical protein